VNCKLGIGNWGFKGQGAGAGCKMQGARVQGVRCRVWGAGCRVQDAECRVQGAEGSGLSVWVGA
jgi:hypothetical protein